MSVWKQLMSEIEDFMGEVRKNPVQPQVNPSELRTKLERRYTFELPTPIKTITDEMIQLLKAQTVHVTHPRYFGLFNPSVREASIVADTLTALYNPQLATWSHAPAANEIERITLNCLAKELGFDQENILANFATGGAEANLSAVLAALAHHFPNSGKTGLSGLASQPLIYLTSESHHSFVKIARMTGLGTDALVEVPVSKRFTLDIDGLIQQVESDLRHGRHPLMVVGTAGTTGAGLIDPLNGIADVTERFGLWFHADAAWGGSAVLSPNLKHALAGIERADSVTWDAHKWLFVPMGAGMFFCRHPEAVKRAFAVSTSYMPQKVDDLAIDQYTTTAQWSRRAIGLKVFMAFAELGIDGYRQLIEHQAKMGDFLRLRLRELGWTICNETPLPVVCFTHPDIKEGRRTAGELLDTIYGRGRVWISDVALGGRVVLRACVTSFHTNKSDIECLIEELEYARSR